MTMHNTYMQGAIVSPGTSVVLLTNPGPGALSIALWDVDFFVALQHNVAAAVVAQAVNLSVDATVVMQFLPIVVGNLDPVNVPVHFNVGGNQYLLGSGKNVTFNMSAGPAVYRGGITVVADVTSGS